MFYKYNNWGFNVIQGLSICFKLLWRPWWPPKNNFLIRIKTSVYSRGAAIWVSSNSFHKNYIAWPQQPPTEKVPNISEILDFWWSFPQKGTSIGHFVARDDQTIMIRNFFEEIVVVRLARPMRLPRLLRLQRFLGSSKSLWGLQSHPGSWIQWFKDIYEYFEKNRIFYQIMKIPLNFSNFSFGGLWGQPLSFFWKLVDETQMATPR